MGCFISCDQKPEDKIYALQNAIDALNKTLVVQEKTKEWYLEKAARECENASRCQEIDKFAHLKRKEIYQQVANQYGNVQLILRREVILLESLKQERLKHCKRVLNTNDKAFWYDVTYFC